MRTLAILILVGSLGVLAWDLSARGAATTSGKHADLRTRLASTDGGLRADAVRELAASPAEPDRAVLLFTLADDRDERVRYALEQALSTLKDAASLDWMASVGLTYPDRWVRFHAALGLVAGRGREALPVLLPALGANYWEVEWGILDALGRVIDGGTVDRPEVRAALLPLLGADRHWRVRSAALELLGRGSDPATVDALLEAGRKLDPIRDAALLAEIEDTLGAMGAAADHLAARAEKAESAGTRALALRALGGAGTEAHVALCRQLLEKDPAEEIRVTALWTAVRLGGKGLAETLLPILRTGPERLRGAAAAALAARLVPLDAPALAALATLVKEAPGPGPVTSLLAGLVATTGAAATPPPALPTRPWGAEAALEAGAAWLVRNQEPDGRWSSSRGNPWEGRPGFPGLFPDDAARYYDPAVTGWTIIALLASGSDTDKGPHRDAVRRGVAWLLSIQKPNGLFKADREMPPPSTPNPDYPRQVQYAWALNHLLPTLAVVECLQHNAVNVANPLAAGAGPKILLDPRLKAAAGVAMDAIKDGGLPDEYDLFNKKTIDVSKICLIGMCRYAWAKCAEPLKENKKLNDAALKRVTELLTELAQSGTTTRFPFDFDAHYWFRSHAGNSSAVIAAMLLSQKTVRGLPIDSFIDESMSTVRLHPPVWNPYYEIVGPAGHPPVEETILPGEGTAAQPSAIARISAPWKDDIVNFDYWFHAALATFLRGEDDWYEWDRNLKLLLPRHQRKSGEEFGSWDPADPWSRIYGRTYSTALSVLTLSLPRKNLSFSQVEWKRFIPLRRPVGNKPPGAAPPAGGGAGAGS